MTRGLHSRAIADRVASLAGEAGRLVQLGRPQEAETTLHEAMDIASARP